MSEAKNAKSGGERMRKYREENKLRNELSNVKQQVEHPHILISVATLPSYHHVITLPYRHGPKNHMGDTFTEKS